MLNVLDHQGNTNQNDTEIPPHPCQKGYTQTITNAGEDVGEKNPYSLLVGT
jgi:hypothetical protein